MNTFFIPYNNVNKVEEIFSSIFFKDETCYLYNIIPKFDENIFSHELMIVTDTTLNRFLSISFQYTGVSVKIDTDLKKYFYNNTKVLAVKKLDISKLMRLVISVMKWFAINEEEILSFEYGTQCIELYTYILDRL